MKVHSSVFRDKLPSQKKQQVIFWFQSKVAVSECGCAQIWPLGQPVLKLYLCIHFKQWVQSYLQAIEKQNKTKKTQQELDAVQPWRSEVKH